MQGRYPTSVRRKTWSTRRSNPRTFDSCSAELRLLRELYSRLVPYDTMFQCHLVLAAVEEPHSTPTYVVHLVRECSLSLHLHTDRVRPCNQTYGKRSPTALTRSIEYGRSSVYALMILLNLHTIIRLNVKVRSKRSVRTSEV